MKYIVVGLGDLHFNSVTRNEELYELKINALIKSVIYYSKDYICKNIILLINGDLIEKGDVSNFDLAYLFIQNIVEELKKIHLDVSTILVPGNHDNEFKYKQSLKEEIETIRNKIISSTKGIDYSILINEDKSLLEFGNLENEFENSHINQKKLFFKEYLYKNEIKNLKWLSLNTTVFCDETDAQGKICVDKEEIQKNLFYKENDIIFTALHYPFEWFDRDSPDVVSYIKKISDVIFVSHEHSGKFAEFYEDTKTIIINLPKYTSDNDVRLSGYMLSLVNLEANKLKVIEFSFNGDSFVSDKEKQRSFEIKKYTLLSNSIVSLEKSKLSYLDSIGDYFENKSNIKLDDIYINPVLHLNEISSEEQGEVNMKHIELPDLDISDDFTIIRGEKSSGKSTIISKLYFMLFEDNKIPLIIKGHQLAKNMRDTRAYEFILQQFDWLYEDNIEIIKQNSKQSFVLIDDIDHIKNISKLNELLLKLKSLGIKVVATSSISFGLSTKISKEIDSTISSTTFNIKPFSNVQLYTIIDKWYVKDDSLSDEERHRLIFKTKSIISNVAKNRMVTLNPMFTILLLEANDENYITTLIESSNFVYYQYLVNKAVIKVSSHSKIDTGTIIEFLEYMGFFILNNDEFSYDSFKSEYIGLFPIDDNAFDILFNKLKVFLKNRNILMGDFNTYVRFNHDFVFYYFASSYLGKYTKSYKSNIVDMIKNINIEENANVISFLVQFTREDFIFKNIIALTNTLFIDDKEIKCNSDIGLLNKLIVNVDRIEKFGDLKTNNLSLNKEIDSKYNQSRKLSNEEREKLKRAKDSELGINIAKGVKILQINGELLKQSLFKETKESLTSCNIHLILRIIGNYTETFMNQLLISFSNEGDLLDREIIPDGINIFIWLFILGATTIGGEKNTYSVKEFMKKNDNSAHRLLNYLFNVMSRKDENDRFNSSEIREIIKYYDEEKNYICKAIVYSILEFHLNYVGITPDKIIELSNVINISDKQRAKMLKKSFENKNK